MAQSPSRNALLARRAQSAARLCAGATAMLGVSVLLGWLLDSELLLQWLPQGKAMAPSTAICFFLAGLALHLSLRPPARNDSPLLSLATLLPIALAGGRLIEAGVARSAWMDGWLLAALDGSGQASANMAPATAVALLLSGAALFLLDRTKRHAAVHLLVGISFAIAFLVVLGYLYDIESLYGQTAFSSVAVPTAVGILLLDIGILLSRPQRGLAAVLTSPTAAGALMRRLLPLSILFPFCLGWIHAASQPDSVLASGLGTALFAVIYTVLLIAFTGIALSRTHASEEALQASEQRYRTLADNAMEGIAVSDQGVLVDANPRLIEMLGYPREEVIGAAIEKFLPPEARAVTMANIQGARDSQIQHELLRQDGTRRVVEAHGRTIDDGQRHLRITSLRDITELKETENALRESEAEFRIFFENAGVGAAEVSMQGRFVRVNDRYCEMTGYSCDELLRKGPFDITHPDDCVDEDMRFRQYLNGEIPIYQVEKRYVRKDGKIIWVALSASLIRDAAGQPLRSIAIVLDVTQRKQTEAALNDRKRELTLALQASSAGTWHYDFLTGRVHWSPESFHLHGMPVAPEAPTYEQWFALLHPDDAAVHKAAIPALIANRQAEYRQTFRVLLPDGGTRWILGLGRIEYDAHGQPLQMMGINVDISAQKAAEERMHAALQEAERANQAKSRFLAAASHDLRQPMAALSLYADLLASHLDTAGQPLLGNMKDCLGNLNELMKNLLDLSKLEAGVIVAKPADFAVDGLLCELAAQFGAEAQAAGLSFRRRPSTLIARTDPLLFRRLLGNFISNAVRYTRQGGVLLACRRHAGKTWVEVWDTGCGFPQEKSAEIFEEFRQLGDGARNRGSGLGLAIAARSADLLGLAIRVHSRPGRGSLFAVELPEGMAECIPPPAEAPPLAFHPLRIAVVEDNDDVRTALFLGLQRLGHDVVASPSGRALYGQLAAFRPDIVISDYRLADGETGLEVIGEARRRLTPAMRALLLTGDTDPQLVRDLARSGIAIVHKPADLETIQAYIEDLMAEPSPSAATADAPIT